MLVARTNKTVDRKKLLLQATKFSIKKEKRLKIHCGVIPNKDFRKKQKPRRIEQLNKLNNS
jgi:hypothetical protein